MPPGSLSSPTSISITRGVSEFKVATTRTVINAELGPSGQSFNPPAVVTFAWSDTNNNGLIDNTTIQEANLKIWRNGVLFAGPCSSATYQQPACATACNGLECCCDMNANAWTLRLDHFSQYIVGDDATTLIPGGGSKATDCIAEFDAVAPKSPLAKSGLPNATRTCTDGDPTCDADGTVDGICTFTVSACVNVTDPRLQDKSGNVVCTATDVATVTLKSPKPDNSHPDKAAAAIALRGLFAGLAPSTVGGTHNDVVTYSTPLATAGLCSGATEISVPLNGKKRRSLPLKVQARSTGSVTDTDTITLKCVAP